MVGGDGEYPRQSDCGGHGLSVDAEAVKLTENIFRAVNFALTKELKVIYEAIGIDIREIVEAAKTEPFGYMPFYPGPRLGGSDAGTRPSVG